MSFRNLTGDGDWVYGAGKNSYATENAEIALNIQTRVLSFLGDCFFATDEGIDWFNLLDYNRQAKLENSVKKTILETDGVVNILSLDITQGANRKLILTYDIQTIYTESYQNQLEIFDIME